MCDRRYTAIDHTVTLAADDYIARFRDEKRILGLCRECPNYCRNWGCPPFGFDTGEVLRQYSHAFLIATKITPAQPGLPLSCAGVFIRDERERIGKKLLQMERENDGRAFIGVGCCRNCGDAGCTRPLGLPCRHPDTVRPSLEAFGFDIQRTLSELFGFGLLWGRDGVMPPYLTLVTGLLYSRPPLLR